MWETHVQKIIQEEQYLGTHYKTCQSFFLMFGGKSRASF